MSKVEYKKVLLTGTRRILEKVKANMKRKRWEFLELIYQGIGQDRIVFALFRRSILGTVSRRMRRLGTSIRQRVACRMPRISSSWDEDDVPDEFNPFTAMPGFIPVPGTEPQGYFA